jgi:hypothetical protein
MAYKLGFRDVKVRTDSQYVVNGTNQWVHGWSKRGWRTADGGEIKNQELWETVLKAKGHMKIEAEWVRGHSGNRWNEMADRLAGYCNRTGTSLYIPVGHDIRNDVIAGVKGSVTGLRASQERTLRDLIETYSPKASALVGATC